MATNTTLATSNTNTTTTIGNTMNTELTYTQTNSITMNLSATLVREELCNPREALGLAVAFTSCVEYLMTDSAEWKHRLLGTLEGVWVGNEKLRPMYVLDMLVQAGYVTVIKSEDCLSEQFVTGSKLIDDILLDRASIPPVLASEGISKIVADGTAVTNRRRGYGKTNYGEVAASAINALEETKLMKSDWTLGVLREAYILGDKQQRDRLDTEMFVLKGTGAMITGEAYVVEYFFDNRGRMNQVNCLGVNSSSSDLARGVTDLHGVSKDYNSKLALGILLEEISDMCKVDCMDELNVLIDEANVNPAVFYLKHMKIKGKLNSNVTKPCNFFKVANIIKELRLNHKPYIGVAVGLDAKCSGPQLGGCMVADDKILLACGFTTKNVDDAYERAIKFCSQNQIHGMTRSAIKKAFMAIFYGAGVAAMANFDTIEQEAYGILYPEDEQQDEDAVQDVSKRFHRSIVLSFGRELNALRKRVVDAGILRVKDMPTVSKYNKPVRYLMPDGFEVATVEKVRINADGIEFIDTEGNKDVQVYCNGQFTTFEKPTFRLKEFAYDEYARKGFVNMIQATDAQLARLIILHCKRLGAQHIISIHDCFRVNINEVSILEEAIQLAYLELFGSVKDEPTTHFKNGTDILKSYFKGSEEASKDEYKNTTQPYSQFYTNGRRVLNNIGGVKFTTLVRQLGKTKYFAK